MICFNEEKLGKYLPTSTKDKDENWFHFYYELD